MVFFLELELNTKRGTAKERTHLFIFMKYIKKIQIEKTLNMKMRKNATAIKENKLTVLIRSFYRPYDN